MGITRVTHACAATMTVVSAGVASALVPVATHADTGADTTIVVNNYDFGEDDPAISRYGFVTPGCDGNVFDSDFAGTSHVAVRGPATPPLGERSWKVTVPDGNDGTGPFMFDDSMRDPQVGMSYYAEDDLTGVALVDYLAPDAEDVRYVGTAPLSTTGADEWQQIDASDLDYTWRAYSVGDDAAPVGEPLGTSTRAEFAAEHGDGAARYVIALGCGGGVFSTDAWSIGDEGSVRTYDLEGVTATATMGQAPARVTAGDPVKLTVRVLTGQLDDDDEPFPGNGRIDLEAQAADGSWDTVRSIFPDAQGRASATVEPERTTTYRWRALETGAVEEATSETTTVAVRSAVTAKAPRAVGKGKAIAVRGDVVPGEGRPTVTLWREGKGGPTSVDTARTGADGSFTLATRAKGGKNRLYVTVPATDDTLAGRSRTVVVRGR